MIVRRVIMKSSWMPDKRESQLKSYSIHSYSSNHGSSIDVQIMVSQEI